ncbi:hypothetical protein CVU82_02765 [Candidatus Falkowbacteria bacterium HGW-Falkowbacteria-1]|uniref:Uncharacterized protein n=1 Tax=Candidatus Falkowbacteria bacterium HGW-Falkowbacteria-1 TaxID=2013768 RepID=A0A2N2E9T0_9BACT|nr:MAG: hypothetical protein CVU82_02765 [Candidatus Falkowbacteria bacterium HGW-Falkowbacteria-1]
MKHVWSIICQQSSIDSEKNLLSLFTCIEEMSVLIDKDKVSDGKKIIIPAEFQLVSFWTIEDSSKENNLELKGELVDPDNQILSSFSNSFVVKSGVSRFRNRTNIQGFPVTREGRYHLNVSQKVNGGSYELVAELPVDIKINYQIMKISK